MNYFLYGPDTYRSRRKLHEIVDAYRAKQGGSADLHWIDAGDGGIDSLEEAGGTEALFSRKKTIVLERAVSSGVGPERLAAFLKKYKGSRDTIVIVWEEGIGERQKKICAELKNHADKSQEFGLLAGSLLARWIREEAGRRGVRLAPDDHARLAAMGPDLWAVANEMEKIAVALAPARVPTAVGTRAPSSVFDLGDAFFSSRGAALRHLLNLLEQGEDELPLFSYLANHARTMLILKISAEERKPPPPTLAIHPYVIKKTARLVAGLDRDTLLGASRRFFEEDVAIKTGGTTPRDALVRMILGAAK